LGSIGTRVAAIANGFGMDVIVTDPYVTTEQVAQAGGRKVDLDELLTTSDVISLHIPLTPATRHTINADAIAKMRPRSVLINTARGGPIDEQALIDALRSGHLGGAGVDLLDAENVDMKDPLPHNRLPLDEIENLIVTPHVAGQTSESLRNVGAAALTCIQQALAGDTPDHALNTIAEPRIA
jgi:phosphoglycerate dehydrogenase-like enzyme